MPRGQSDLLAYNNEYQTLGMARPTWYENTPKKGTSTVPTASLGLVQAKRPHSSVAYGRPHNRMRSGASKMEDMLHRSSMESLKELKV